MFNDGIQLNNIYDQFSNQFSKYISGYQSDSFKTECWEMLMDKILSALVQHIFKIQKRPKNGLFSILKHGVFCNSKPAFYLKNHLVDYLYKVQKTKVILGAIKVLVSYVVN